MMKIAVLISGYGGNLQAIMDAIANQRLNCEIAVVLSNEPDAYGLQRAEKAGIKTAIINHKTYDDRATFDEAIIEVLEAHGVELVVLAGFMRILSETFIRAYPNRILNIHPSVLPQFKGLNTYERALKAKATYHGTTVHLVGPALDSGPILAYAKCQIRADDTAASLQQRVQKLEHQVYWQVIAWFSNQRISFEETRIILDEQPLATTGVFFDVDP